MNLVTRVTNLVTRVMNLVTRVMNLVTRVGIFPDKTTARPSKRKPAASLAAFKEGALCVFWAELACWADEEQGEAGSAIGYDVGGLKNAGDNHRTRSSGSQDGGEILEFYPADAEDREGEGGKADRGGSPVW